MTFYGAAVLKDTLQVIGNNHCVNNITQVSCFKVLGVTLQSNHRFNEHIKIKLQEANKCLYVIRCLRKEGYQQPEVDYVFRSIVLSKLTYGLPIHASSIPELTTVQNFLQRCFKRKYISYQIDIYNVLEVLFKKISSMPGHPLAVNFLGLIPRVLKIVFLIGYFSNIE